MKQYILLFALLLLSASFATDIDTCQTFATANTAYTLNASISSNGGCFVINAANVTLDGNGFSITGNATTSAGIGVSVLAGGATSNIRNLIIYNYTSAITLAGQANITNVTGYGANTTTTGTMSFAAGSSNSILRDSYFETAASSANGHGILVFSGTTDITGVQIINTIGNATAANGIHITCHSVGTQIINSTGISAASRGINTECTASSTGTQITGSVGNASGAAGRGISIGTKNTTIDCRGRVMTGASAANSYGFYINDENINVSNCALGNWTYGLYIISNNLAKITNISCAVGGTCGAYFSAAKNTTLNNVTLNSTGTTLTVGNALTADTLIINSVLQAGTSAAYYAIDYSAAAAGVRNNSLINSTVLSGVVFSNSPFTTIQGNTFYSSSTFNAISISTTGTNNVVDNNTIIHSGTGTCVGVVAAASGSIVTNTICSSNNTQAPMSLVGNNARTENLTITSIQKGCGTFEGINSTFTNVDCTGASGAIMTLRGTNVNFTNLRSNGLAGAYVITSALNNANIINSSFSSPISNANSYGLYFATTTNTVVSGSNITGNTSNGAVYLNGAFSNITITNSKIEGNAGTAVLLNGATLNNITFQNNIINGAYIRLTGTNHNLINNTGTFGAAAWSNTVLSGSTIANNRFNVTSAASYCTEQYTNHSNNMIANNTLYCSGKGGFVFSTSASTNSNNTFYNNTLTNVSTGVLIPANSGGNLFYLNNITGAVWVNDANGTNSYNYSGMGNKYYAANGTAAYDMFNISSSTTIPYADQGSSRPFNATTVGAYFTGAGLPADWYPYTLKTQPTNFTILTPTAGVYPLGTAVNITWSAPTNAGNYPFNYTVSLLNLSGVLNSTIGSTGNLWIMWTPNTTGAFIIQVVAMTDYGSNSTANMTNIAALTLSQIITIQYPATGTDFQQCGFLIITNGSTNLNTATYPATVRCDISRWNTTAYNLVQSATSSSFNNSFAIGGLTVTAMYRVNCTATQLNYSVSTAPIFVTLSKTSSCGLTSTTSGGGNSFFMPSLIFAALWILAGMLIIFANKTFKKKETHNDEHNGEPAELGGAKNA